MNMNVRKKSLLIFLIIFSVNLKYTEAATISPYSSLNIETTNFINRLNQLPQVFTFNKNLKRGTPVLPDVQYLKWVLNSDKRTSLTDNPNMTLSELTKAYGPLTEDAVKRFQIIYRSEILDPQGIKNATGIVGKGTRQKLNWLLAQSRTFNNIVNNTPVNTNTNYNTGYVDFYYTKGSTNNTGLISTSTNTNISTTTTEAPNLTAQTRTTNTGSSISSDGNSSSGIVGTLAVLGGVALLGGATNTSTQIALSQFGGKIIMNTPCLCSSNYMITLLDLSTKTPLSVMFQPGVSSLKMNYNPTVGENIIGGYIRGSATCLIYVGSGCSPSPTGIPVGTIDTIRGVGTTLTPVKK